MATTKVTFTFDPATIHRLNDAAERLSKPKSEVVREAIEEYHQRIGRLSETERQRRLKVLDDYHRNTPLGTRQETLAQLKELRLARLSGGRRHPN